MATKRNDVIVKRQHGIVLRQLPPSTYREIGRIVFKFAHLEYVLTEIVYLLVKVDRRIGRLAVRAPRAPDLIDMINDLIDARGMAIDHVDVALSKAVEQSLRDRDLLAHGNWVTSAIDGQPKVVSARGKGTVIPGENKSLKRQQIPEGIKLTPARFREMTASIDSSIKQLYLYRDRVLKELQASPQILRPPLLLKDRKNDQKT